MSWIVEEPGIYQIQISNLNSTELMGIKGYFDFIRWYERKPFLYLGYALLSVGILYLTLMIFKALGKLIKGD